MFFEANVIGLIHIPPFPIHLSRKFFFLPQLDHFAKGSNKPKEKMVSTSISQHFCCSAIPETFHIVSGSGEGELYAQRLQFLSLTSSSTWKRWTPCLITGDIRSIKEELLQILFLWKPKLKNWQDSRHWEILGSPRPIKHSQILNISKPFCNYRYTIR